MSGRTQPRTYTRYDDTIETKVCTRCQLAKPIDQFARHPEIPGARLSTCRSCRGQAINARAHGRPANPPLAPAEFWDEPEPTADDAWYARVKARLHAARKVDTP